MFDHNTLPILIYLRFSLDALNLQTEVLCLTSMILKIDGVILLQ